jgi:hypothetical protein
MPNYLYDEKELLQRKVTERVSKFMIENDISCEDTIYQCDWVIKNAYDFISDLYTILNEQYQDKK